jgi:cellulose synthase/poly-beta-1,6-N-acetylglucosamine synthase-like glycosyltransferase
MVILSLTLLCIVLVPLGHLLLLAVAAIPSPKLARASRERPSCRFCVLIAAYNEDTVIGATVAALRKLDYPPGLFSVCVVADHCTDNTAAAARDAGATVYERGTGLRTSKGAAVAWLIERVLESDASFDAALLIDADNRPAPDLLSVMARRLATGSKIIQGKHVIANPHDNLFTSFVWTLFTIDNRFQNLGRRNLGWSAKNMGDTICFRADVLRGMSWPDMLAEDHFLRQRLLLEGVRIDYEPAAAGYGEAPRSWKQATAQRMRWLAGTYRANGAAARHLAAVGLKRRNGALIDAALQAYFPSYSTLTLLTIAAIATQLLIAFAYGVSSPPFLLGAWLAAGAALMLYPFLALMLERAPLWAYGAVALGPAFVAWRTVLAVRVRLGRNIVGWVRTQHGSAPAAQ